MSGGGDQTPRDVNNYSPPKGPTNVNDPKGPGLHGDNFGNCGGISSGSAQESGSPGLHGDNSGNCGSQ